ncbi:MAG: hypothetical protein KF809_02090 [Chloroflexi bacterium]|nr:hypothetical protein [Chloroflexota bacterium]
MSGSTRTVADLPRTALWHGRAEPPTRPQLLRAGPVSALLDGADLRHIRLGGVELVQRVYVAVRDAPWNTIPAQTSDWVVATGPDRFKVTFMARHRHEDISFHWRGVIEGTPDGVIRYEMDGQCRGVFRYSKIGFNVHHALDGSVGRAYRARTERGERTGVLPTDIDPQRIVDGTLSGMFEPYSELAIEVVDGLEAVVALEGDLLELQDHRNWTDANFKSYATPLALGFPFDSSDGQRIRQVLTIRSRGEAPPATEADPVITLGEATGRGLPTMGLGAASHDAPLDPVEVARLRELAPAHLRVDVALRPGVWQATLDRGIADAASLGAPLELAVQANEGSGEQLGLLAVRLRTSGSRVARVLVLPLADGFSAFVTTTPAAVVALVRDALLPVTGEVVFAGGTDQSFADINRDRPTDPVLTGLCLGVCPTFHAADDASIVENLAGQSDVVRFAALIAAPRSIHVSPVTLATRFGPYPAGPARPGDLPPAVDVRQASLLGAAWTVGSAAALASAGAASITWYETSGWRGVVERATGSPMPDRFPSVPGQVFPPYHVLADLAGWRDGQLCATRTSDPLRVVALAVAGEQGARVGLLVANVTAEPQRVRLVGLGSGAMTATVRILDEATATWALEDPARFRADPGAPLPLTDGTACLALGPYAVARIDLVRGPGTRSVAS